MMRKRFGKPIIDAKRQPPVHIPLDFETAVTGLLQVQPDSPKRTGRNKPAKKKTGR